LPGATEIQPNFSRAALLGRVPERRLSLSPVPVPVVRQVSLDQEELM